MAVPTAERIAAGLEGFSKDVERLDRIKRYHDGDHDGPYKPKAATDEYKLLMQRSITNWIPLLVKTPSQALTVNGFRRSSTDSSDESPPEWQAWRANRMDARQGAVHDAALMYGLAYVSVLPDKIDGTPKLRGVSPRRLYASYEDPANDVLPLWALEIDSELESDSDTSTGRLIDDTSVIELIVSGDGGYKQVSAVRHGMTLDGKPVCPVVRFAPDIDIEGGVTGVVEPMIPIQDRVNQTVFDLLVAQTFGSFKVRTISGMAPEFETDSDGNTVYDSTTGKPKVKAVQASASRFLMAPDADTKFGQLDETPLGGFLEAIEAGVKQMAAISQTPPHYLLGSIVNLSAEALAAAEAALTRAVHDYQDCLGESWEVVFSLVGSLLGIESDPNSEVQWADHESRSLSQTVDALGKAATMLKIPPRVLWSRIPGVSRRDVEDWQQIREQDDEEMRFANSLVADNAPAVADESP